MTKIRPRLSEPLKRLKRGPAITIPKDFGLIVAYSGIDKNSKVVEIGTGSGFLTIQLARIVKKVTTYEKREEFAEIAQVNFDKLGLKNIKLKNKDGLKGIREKNIDLLVLDIANAEKLVGNSTKVLKKGAYLVAHCLSIEQSKALVLECKKYLSDVFMLEAILREYDVNEVRTRPKHLGMLHTAYLVFAKK